jgi:hypothetical protein
MRLESNKTSSEGMMLTRIQAGALQNSQSPVDAVMGGDEVILGLLLTLALFHSAHF